ncbi:hypothetical protein UC34_14685 [Pandoraea vervacti]|uniref:DUF262 domain-containing protein n=1 Tax=Pandoraea vervacti TaxID=656178 RepID=A0ABM5SZ49_9BURK|nr:hypothetical protein [Pandoraea vervacti]AJP57883.1 hypothetical protein UC34_14685 [Pandoraea vervacti]
MESLTNLLDAKGTPLDRQRFKWKGKDANNILQGYADIVPGRPTRVEHRAPQDDIRANCSSNTSSVIRRKFL